MKSFSHHAKSAYARTIGLLSAGFLFASTAGAQTPVQFNPVPTRSVGHAKLQLVSAAPNLVEGRELYQPLGVAVDTNVLPNILYVSDTNNNRILVWSDSRAANGSRATAVIGQNDFFATTPGGPGTASSIGLRSPTGLAVDRQGNLFVVDSGNNRILRYSRVDRQGGDVIQPTMVIGQTSFSVNQPNQGNSAPTARTLALATSNETFSS